jgi:hypothetical protein
MIETVVNTMQPTSILEIVLNSVGSYLINNSATVKNM